MPRIRVLSKGARIAGGVICLLLALHSGFWIVRDVVELGGGATWDVWTGGLRLEAGGLTESPTTNSNDLAQGILQLTAAFAAFSGAWTAGGLLASTAAITFSERLPVIWAAPLHGRSSRFLGRRACPTTRWSWVRWSAASSR
jgi:hypothetical protein